MENLVYLKPVGKAFVMIISDEEIVQSGSFHDCVSFTWQTVSSSSWSDTCWGNDSLMDPPAGMLLKGLISKVYLEGYPASVLTCSSVT